MYNYLTRCRSKSNWMAIKSQASLVAVFTCLALLISCQPKAAKELSYGTFEDGVYANDYLGFSLQLPEDWHIQSQAQLQAQTEMGQDLIAGDDELLKRQMKASEQQSVSLFSAFQYQVGQTREINPNITGVVERVSLLSGVKSGADYHKHAKDLLTKGQMDYRFSTPVYSVSLNGKNFDVLYAELHFQGVVVKQKYYASLIEDYILLFVTSYGNDQQDKMLESILQEINFS